MAQRPPRPRELVTIGSSLVGSVVFGLVVGLLLDHALQTSPIFVLVGLAVGVVGALALLVTQIRKFMRD